MITGKQSPHRDITGYGVCRIARRIRYRVGQGIGAGVLMSIMPVAGMVSSEVAVQWWSLAVAPRSGNWLVAEADGYLRRGS